MGVLLPLSFVSPPNLYWKVKTPSDMFASLCRQTSTKYAYFLLSRSKVYGNYFQNKMSRSYLMHVYRDQAKTNLYLLQQLH